MSAATGSAHRATAWVLAATAAAFISALMLLVSLAARWVAEGPGSTYAGYRLAAVLRDGTVRPEVADTVYWTLLAVGIAAVAIAGSAPFTTPPARVARGSIGGTVVLALAAAGVFGAFPLAVWASGPWLAIAGGVAAVVSSVLPVARRRESMGARS